MKELETHLKIGNGGETRTEMNVKKQQEIEYILEGTIKPIKGHFVWEVNKITLEVNKAEYKQDTVSFNAFAKKEPEKLIVNTDCVYIPSLNARNALNKYKANPDQKYYFVKEAPMNLSELKF